MDVVLTPNEVRDKYRNRQKDSNLETICKLMVESGVTLAELEEYIEKRVTVVDRIRQHRKKNDTKRRFANGIKTRNNKAKE